MTDWTNQVYFGDNLGVLREHVADESVDLIYLAPPFNSDATYNVLFQESRARSRHGISSIKNTRKHTRLDFAAVIRTDGFGKTTIRQLTA